MILSKLFSSKPNWQHKEVNIRINAIENELNITNDQDKQVLINIVENDESDLVRRAALIRLNDPQLWLSKGLTDAASSTVKMAENKLVDFITSAQSLLNLQDKLTIIEGLNNAFAERVLAKATDTSLIIALLEKLAKPHLFMSVFAQQNSAEVQQYIVGQINESATLEKLAKKTALSEVLTTINNKINDIQLAAEKPEKIKKEGQLILSKLLALKDVSDYNIVVAKRNALNAQWQALTAEFIYLDDDKIAEFDEKFQQINESLTALFTAKEEQYQQAKIEQALIAEQQAVKLTLSQFIDNTTQAITTAIFENESINESQLAAEIGDAKQKLLVSNLPANEKSFIAKQIDELTNKLKHINEIAQSVANATHLISKMAQQQPPEILNELVEKQTMFNAWLKEWNSNLSLASGVLPQSIIDAFKEIQQKWNQALTPLEKAQQKQFFQCQRKVSDLKRLIASGKYNAAFGVFNKFKQLYCTLSSEQQTRLNKDYELLTEKMNELSDWEHYIATPRKQSLLAEVNLLAETPLNDPLAQADKVKHYRKLWNSLGHAEREVEDSLNQAFNDAIEKAFAPCRAYYAEQENLREKHLSVRQQILHEANELSATLPSMDSDIKHIETSLNQLIKKWREAGEVDRQVYRKVNEQFQCVIKPIKQLVKQYHEENIDAKLTLIALAEKQLAQDDIFIAVQEIKSIQKQWKNIGYAGVRKENELWNKFRKINDQIFARRDEQTSQQQMESEAKLKEIRKQIIDFEKELTEISQPKLVTPLIDKANALLASLTGNSHINKEAKSSVQKFIEQCLQAKRKLNQHVAMQDWQLVFGLIRQLSKNEINESDLVSSPDYQRLSSKMKSNVDTAVNAKPNANRQLLTIELEIIAGIDSPTTEQDSRIERQLALMQEKMTSGTLASKEDKFWQWLGEGKLTEQDLPYIERVKQAFIA